MMRSGVTVFLGLSTVLLGSGYAEAQPVVGPPVEPPGLFSADGEERAAQPLAEGPKQAREQASERAEVDVRPSSFRGITPGETTAEEVLAILGEPLSKAPAEEGEAWTFKEPPFGKLIVTIDCDRAESIVLHLKAPTPVAKIATELGLDQFEAASVLDEAGASIGRVYPDRGVLLALSAADSQTAQQIVLEPITAEPFLLRVAQDRRHRYERSLADLDRAASLDASLDAEDARSAELRAQILAATGQREEARGQAERAFALEPTPARRLLVARLYRTSAELTAGIADLQAMLETGGLAELELARAECLLADLVTLGEPQGAKQAFELHVSAIQRAAALEGDAGATKAARRLAKETLLDAHLGAAMDVASGGWRDPERAVAAWLSRAEAIADDLVRREGSDDSLRLEVCRRSLAAYAALGGRLDAKTLGNRAMIDGRGYIAATNDSLRKRELEWNLGEALYFAARVAQDRKDQSTALKFADNALALLEAGEKLRPGGAAEDALLGRLYYTIGASYADSKGGNHTAVQWYDKALLRLSAEDGGYAGDPASYPSTAGDRLIAMGVSYWRTGQFEKGKELTEQGARLLQDRVHAGLLPEAALAVCYGNLAAMHEHFADFERAKTFAENAALLRADGATKR